MGEIRIEVCDLCGRALDLQGILDSRKRKHGMVINLGLSKGGWGNRENPVNVSQEVCVECFGEYEKIVVGMKHWLDSRKGINTPTVNIFEGTTGTTVSETTPLKTTLALK